MVQAVASVRLLSAVGDFVSRNRLRIPVAPLADALADKYQFHANELLHPRGDAWVDMEVDARCLAAVKAYLDSYKVPNDGASPTLESIVGGFEMHISAVHRYLVGSPEHLRVTLAERYRNLGRTLHRIVSDDAASAHFTSAKCMLLGAAIDCVNIIASQLGKGLLLEMRDLEAFRRLADILEGADSNRRYLAASILVNFTSYDRVNDVLQINPQFAELAEGIATFDADDWRTSLLAVINGVKARGSAEVGSPAWKAQLHTGIGAIDERCNPLLRSVLLLLSEYESDIARLVLDFVQKYQSQLPPMVVEVIAHIAASQVLADARRKMIGLALAVADRRAPFQDRIAHSIAGILSRPLPTEAEGFKIENDLVFLTGKLVGGGKRDTALQGEAGYNLVDGLYQRLQDLYEKRGDKKTEVLLSGALRALARQNVDDVRAYLLRMVFNPQLTGDVYNNPWTYLHMLETRGSELDEFDGIPEGHTLDVTFSSGTPSLVLTFVPLHSTDEQVPSRGRRRSSRRSTMERGADHYLNHGRGVRARTARQGRLAARGAARAGRFRMR